VRGGQVFGQPTGSPKSNASFSAGDGVAAVQCTPMPPAFQASAAAGIASEVLAEGRRVVHAGAEFAHVFGAFADRRGARIHAWMPLTTRSL